MFKVFSALSYSFEIEPEPEKPREWWLCGRDEEGQPLILHYGCNDVSGRIRVHDADACDRLHKNCDVPR